MGFSTQIRARQWESLARNPGVLTAVYMLLACPVSVFFYISTFKLARSFSEGYSGTLLMQNPALILTPVCLLGALVIWSLPLAQRNWLIGGWLVISLAINWLVTVNAHEWGRVAGIALCLPLWSKLLVWLPELWPRSRKPAGSKSRWLLALMLCVAAVVFSFGGNTLHILITFPEMNKPLEGLLLAARVSGLMGGIALFGLPLAMGAVWTFHRWQHGGRVLLGFCGAAVALLVMFVLYNGLRIVGSGLSFQSLAYMLAMAVPLGVAFVRRVTQVGETSADGLVHFGWKQSPFRDGGRAGLPRMLVPLMCLMLFVGIQILAGRAHLYYEWGFATALLYSSLSLGSTWFLLTLLPRRLQKVLCYGALSTAIIGLITFTPWVHNKVVWANYIKFDANMKSMVRIYYSFYPRPEPELKYLRDLLHTSHAMAKTDLTLPGRQELMVSETDSRPNIFIIVVDALRGEAYSGSKLHRKNFPGLAWMASRFVFYDNTWTSYNGTAGSYPAYLNGKFHPSWYRTGRRDWVQHENVLARAGELLGYRCFNLATCYEVLDKAWPPDAGVPVPKGGKGTGDPAVIFPLALQTFEEHLEKTNQPALFYVHVYNMHEPLLRRPGVHFDASGMHWMRALYVHNARYMDLHLLEFLERLEQRELLDNTMVVVTSDHGEELGDFGGLYHGWQLNPYIMHVPLMIHYPRNQQVAPRPGTVSDRPVNLVDLAPTVCQVMGAPIQRASRWQGLSLLEPEPTEARSFPMLSWQTPLVGRVTFNPSRMVVLNPQTGVVEQYLLEKDRWTTRSKHVSPAVLATEFSLELEELFEYWESRSGEVPDETSPEQPKHEAEALPQHAPLPGAGEFLLPGV
jgi:hypothetical protein